LLTAAVIVVCLEQRWRARRSVEALARHVALTLAFLLFLTTTVGASCLDVRHSH
jgi:hypothetical protein